MQNDAKQGEDAIWVRQAQPMHAGAMVRVTIPRHGNANWGKASTFNPKNDLPGAINIAFVDGHSELVKLERLWSLDWHKGWVTPAKRPGK